MRARNSPAAPGTPRCSTCCTAGAGPPNFISDASPARRSSTVAVRAAAGLPAARISRNRLTRGSRGISARRDLQRERSPSRGRPLLEIHAVIGEQRYRQAIDAESDTAGVRLFGVVIVNPPDVPEVLAVIVKAHASGGGSAGIVGNQ